MSLVFSRILKSEVLKNEVDDITKNDEIEHKIVYDTRYCKQSVWYQVSLWMCVIVVSLECGSIHQLLQSRLDYLWEHRRHTGRQSVGDEVAGRECHKHHVKDVRFINRWLLFRVKPALGLVPLSGASSSLSSFLFLSRRDPALLRLHKHRSYKGRLRGSSRLLNILLNSIAMVY